MLSSGGIFGGFVSSFLNNKFSNKSKSESEHLSDIKKDIIEPLLSTILHKSFRNETNLEPISVPPMTDSIDIESLKIEPSIISFPLYNINTYDFSAFFSYEENNYNINAISQFIFQRFN